MLTNTKLEDYFEYLSVNDIRIKGHRIGIQDLISYYLEGYSPEEILRELPSLNLEKIYATITYYLHNRSELDTYLLRLSKSNEKSYQKFVNNPPALVKRLKAKKAQRISATIE